MAQNIILKRSSLPGKVPDTGSLNVGEIAINTYDGKLFIKRSGNLDSIEGIVVTNSITTGSISLTRTGSFGELIIAQDANITRDLYVTNDIIGAGDIDISGDITGSSALLSGSLILSGSQTITNNLTVFGEINARQFNISVISSSVLFQSGSTKFGDTSDDIHSFTGSVNVTGSLYLNGQEVGSGTTSGSFTGSFTGDGSGLRGVVSDDLPIDGWDYNSNSSASISEFNNESRKYLIDFQWEEEVGTPIGFKTFISNVTGSSQIVPTEEGIKFIVGNQQVALVGPNGIESVAPAGTVSGSSQLTSSYDNRYVLSGSITQTTWDNIASKPSGIVSSSAQTIANLPTGTVSGSSQLTSSVLATTGSNTFIGNQNISGTIFLTGSIIPSGSFIYDLGSETNSFRDLFISTGSIRFHNPDGTEQGRITVDARSGDISLLKTAGLTNEQKASIREGNINPNFLSAISASNIFVQNKIVMPIGGTINDINLTTFSSSVSSTILNLNTATSSYETKGRGIVSGSSQITYASISSIPAGIVSGSSQTIANLPIGVISGSIQVLGGSGIISSSAQLNNASIENLTVINLTTVNETASVIFSSGSNRFGDFGNDIHSFTGSVQISGSITTIGSSTATSYNGTINATNGVVSGSSQVVGILSSLNTYTGSNDTTNTAQNSRLTSIESATGSYETKGRSIVSGSSQITISSTTGYGSVLNQAVLTSSSPTFAGITIGSSTSTFPVNVYTSSANTFGTIAEFYNGDFTAGARTFIRVRNQISAGSTMSSYFGQGQDGKTYIIANNSARGGDIVIDGNNGNVGFGISNPQSQVHLNGTITLTESGFDTVRRHTITHGHSDGSSVNNFVAINVSNGSGTTAERIRVNGSGQLLPAANGTQDLGSTSLRWANIYTNDLHLSNENKVGGNDVDGTNGNWTIQEGEEHLYIINNKTGKKFKFSLEEIQ
jgi:hypothetical protein